VRISLDGIEVRSIIFVSFNDLSLNATHQNIVMSIRVVAHEALITALSRAVAALNIDNNNSNKRKLPTNDDNDNNDDDDNNNDDDDQVATKRARVVSGDKQHDATADAATLAFEPQHIAVRPAITAAASTTTRAAIARLPPTFEEVATMPLDLPGGHAADVSDDDDAAGTNATLQLDIPFATAIVNQHRQQQQQPHQQQQQMHHHDHIDDDEHLVEATLQINTPFDDDVRKPRTTNSNNDNKATDTATLVLDLHNDIEEDDLPTMALDFLKPPPQQPHQHNRTTTTTTTKHQQQHTVVHKTAHQQQHIPSTKPTPSQQSKPFVRNICFQF
jgi:hypothetical protein